jgi:hypothetical protein
MKRLSAALLAGVLLASSLPALADSRGRDHDRGFQRDRYERYDHRGRYNDHYRGQRHNHGNAVLGVLGAGLVLGAIALAAEPYRPPPAPVVVVPARPSAGVWHYCASAGTYYPYTEFCPEGWRAVPATP